MLIQRVAYTGDAEREIQAAKAANMYSNCIWGYIPRDTAPSWGDFNWQPN